MPPIHGSCLCGGVEFEIAGPLTAPLNCHCSQCRKQHGAAFRSRVRVLAKDFRWLRGEHLVMGSSRVDLQACKLEYSIVSPK